MLTIKKLKMLWRKNTMQSKEKFNNEIRPWKITAVNYNEWTSKKKTLSKPKAKIYISIEHLGNFWNTHNKSKTWDLWLEWPTAQIRNISVKTDRKIATSVENAAAKYFPPKLRGDSLQDSSKKCIDFLPIAKTKQPLLNNSQCFLY